MSKSKKNEELKLAFYPFMYNPDDWNVKNIKEVVLRTAKENYPMSMVESYVGISKKMRLNFLSQSLCTAYSNITASLFEKQPKNAICFILNLQNLMEINGIKNTDLELRIKDWKEIVLDKVVVRVVEKIELLHDDIDSFFGVINELEAKHKLKIEPPSQPQLQLQQETQQPQPQLHPQQPQSQQPTQSQESPPKIVKSSSQICIQLDSDQITTFVQDFTKQYTTNYNHLEKVSLSVLRHHQKNLTSLLSLCTSHLHPILEEDRIAPFLNKLHSKLQAFQNLLTAQLDHLEGHLSFVQNMLENIHLDQFGKRAVQLMLYYNKHKDQLDAYFGEVKQTDTSEKPNGRENGTKDLKKEKQKKRPKSVREKPDSEISSSEKQENGNLKKETDKLTLDKDIEEFSNLKWERLKKKKPERKKSDRRIPKKIEKNIFEKSILMELKEPEFMREDENGNYNNNNKLSHPPFPFKVPYLLELRDTELEITTEDRFKRFKEGYKQILEKVEAIEKAVPKKWPQKLPNLSTYNGKPQLIINDMAAYSLVLGSYCDYVNRMEALKNDWIYTLRGLYNILDITKEFFSPENKKPYQYKSPHPSKNKEAAGEGGTDPLGGGKEFFSTENKKQYQYKSLTHPSKNKEAAGEGGTDPLGGGKGGTDSGEKNIISVRPKKVPSTMSDDLKKLINNRQYHDLVARIGGAGEKREVYLHKVILDVRCPEFLKKFTKGSFECDMDFDIFHIILTWIYTGELDISQLSMSDRIREAGSQLGVTAMLSLGWEDPGPPSFKGLLNQPQQQDTCDITIVVEETKFNCHRVLLYSRCPFHKFTTSTSTTANEVFVTGMKPDTFRILLLYIYTDSIEGKENLILELMEFLYRRGVKGIYERLAYYFSNHITVANAAQVYSLLNAYLDPGEGLLQYVMWYIVEHYHEVEHTEGYALLSDALKNSLHSDKKVKLL